MARTVNRQPFTVRTPSSNDVKDYFFNQVNWKGMNDNRNFLAVDQESFEECDNVYVDSEGLLRSRPSVRALNSNSNTVEIRVYGDFEVRILAVDVYYKICVQDKSQNIEYEFAGWYSGSGKFGYHFKNSRCIGSPYCPFGGMCRPLQP